MENQEQNNEQCSLQNHTKCDRKQCIIKVLVIFVAMIIGAFLACLLAISITFNNMFNPQHQMRRMHKEMARAERQIDREYNREMKIDVRDMNRRMPNPIIFNKNNEGYDILVDLRAFSGDAKNIKVDVKDGNILTIKGSSTSKFGNRERMIDLSQTYTLGEKIDTDKIEKRQEGEGYRIKLPFEKKED